MTPDSDLHMDEAWTFITDLYAHEDVKDACLALQEDYGVDVSLLLFLIWLGTRGHIIPTMDIMVELDGVIAAWRENVVKVLRNLRRSLKAMDEEGALRISRMILSSELEAEREALAPLVRAAALMGRASLGGPHLDVRHNVNIYLLFKSASPSSHQLVERVLKPLAA